MRIDEGVKREVLARTDIGTLIGTYVQLTKRGNDLVGLCPFHGEKTPSFHVHPNRGFFKCFGCGKGGDAITFMQQLESLTFPEALRVLAHRVGVELEAENPATARARNEKEHIYAANEFAAAFFHRVLRQSPEAQAARSYVEKRGVTSATVESFKLGFAPPGWEGLVEELRANGIDLALAEKAGLLRPSQRGGYYDFYRNRLMIPTYATTGEVVAFGGRALDDSEPKYLNTSTTPVYTKGRALYALNVARRAALAAEALIVVEGYLDCIALHQAGFANAVASLGTAFTPEQGAELRKYAERIFLCFDSDAAGSAATVKSIDILKAAGCAAFVVQLPPGEDPDTFVRTQGSDAFRERLAGALEATQFALDVRIGEIKRKRLPASQAESEAEAIVSGLPASEADRWYVYLAQALGLSVEGIRTSRFRSNAANFKPRSRLGDAEGSALRGRHIAPAAQAPPIEREVLTAFVEEPALIAEYADSIDAALFADARYRAIYETLRARDADLVTPADVYAALGEDRAAVELIVALQKPDRSSLARFPDGQARRAHLNGVVERLREGRLEARKRELDERLTAAFAAGEAVASSERDEYDRLVEDLERRKKKRLGTK